MVTAALQLCDQYNIRVRALIMDGSHPNQSTARLLGANIDIEDFRPSFPHPSTDDTIHIIFDPCHMVKLVRNLFGDYGVLVDPQGKKILWEYLVRLNEIQKVEGLHVANRLRNAHIEFKTQKMNVRLAAQAMSRSVATALDFLRIRGVTQFAGSEATADFLRHVDQLFDRLNASNPRGVGLKAPINLMNLEDTKQILSHSVDYLKALTIPNGQTLISSRRRMGIIGFMTAAEGIMSLAQDLLLREDERFTYFLPYKCSQDHIETLFSMIRQRGGWNNNPNVLQVRSCFFYEFYEVGVLHVFLSPN